MLLCTQLDTVGRGLFLLGNGARLGVVWRVVCGGVFACVGCTGRGGMRFVCEAGRRENGGMEWHGHAGRVVRAIRRSDIMPNRSSREVHGRQSSTYLIAGPLNICSQAAELVSIGQMAAGCRKAWKSGRFGGAGGWGKHYRSPQQTLRQSWDHVLYCSMRLGLWCVWPCVQFLARCRLCVCSEAATGVWRSPCVEVSSCTCSFAA